MVLIVTITVEVEAERPIFGAPHLLIGAGFLVTVRRGATAAHSPLRERLEASPDLLKRGSDYVASEVLDWLVDRYVAAAGKIESVAVPPAPRPVAHPHRGVTDGRDLPPPGAGRDVGGGRTCAPVFRRSRRPRAARGRTVQRLARVAGLRG
ncbi:hypothetical protein G6F57_021672 [Rhizopus arrhizus]|nr:hypothetical protein G6F57_021672 [Rhizopus arrhizus]